MTRTRRGRAAAVAAGRGRLAARRQQKEDEVQVQEEVLEVQQEVLEGASTLHTEVIPFSPPVGPMEGPGLRRDRRRAGAGGQVIRSRRPGVGGQGIRSRRQGAGGQGVIELKAAVRARAGVGA